MLDTKICAENIKMIRRIVSMSLTNFAKAIGNSRGAVLKWEEAKQLPSTKSLQGILSFCLKNGIEINHDHLCGNVKITHKKFIEIQIERLSRELKGGE